MQKWEIFWKWVSRFNTSEKKIFAAFTWISRIIFFVSSLWEPFRIPWYPVVAIPTGKTIIGTVPRRSCHAICTHADKVTRVNAVIFRRTSQSVPCSRGRAPHATDKERITSRWNGDGVALRPSHRCYACQVRRRRNRGFVWDSFSYFCQSSVFFYFWKIRVEFFSIFLISEKERIYEPNEILP